MISQVYWTSSRKFAFQCVGRFYRVYGEDGDFVKEFTSFSAMDEFIHEHDKDTGYRKPGDNEG